MISKAPLLQLQQIFLGDYCSSGSLYVIYRLGVRYAEDYYTVPFEFCAHKHSGRLPGPYNFIRKLYITSAFLPISVANAQYLEGPRLS